jgi:hypothetical protein
MFNSLLFKIKFIKINSDQQQTKHTYNQNNITHSYTFFFILNKFIYNFIQYQI